MTITTILISSINKIKPMVFNFNFNVNNGNGNENGNVNYGKH